MVFLPKYVLMNTMKTFKKALGAKSDNLLLVAPTSKFACTKSLAMFDHHVICSLPFSFLIPIWIRQFVWCYLFPFSLHAHTITVNYLMWMQFWKLARHTCFILYQEFGSSAAHWNIFILLSCMFCSYCFMDAQHSAPYNLLVLWYWHLWVTKYKKKIYNR